MVQPTVQGTYDQGRGGGWMGRNTFSWHGLFFRRILESGGWGKKANKWLRLYLVHLSFQICE